MIIPTSVAVLSVICILKLHDNLFNCFFYIMGPNFASICFIFHSLLHTLSVYRSIYLYIYLSVCMSVYTTDCVLRYTWLNAAQANILMVLITSYFIDFYINNINIYFMKQQTYLYLYLNFWFTIGPEPSVFLRYYELISVHTMVITAYIIWLIFFAIRPFKRVGIL